MNDDIAILDKRGDTHDINRYRELGVRDKEMDILLEVGFISTMSRNRQCINVLADMVELLLPHHAGAFIIRALKAQSEGNLLEAVQMYLIGMEADVKAEEAVILCMNMLKTHGLEELDLAASLRETLRQSAKGLSYLASEEQAAALSVNDKQLKDVLRESFND